MVTGGGQGLGQGIVKVLASRGATVVVNDLVQERAQAAAATITASGGTALGVGGDVSSREDVQRLLRAARDAFGRVDILVNNAAAFCNKPFLEHTLDEWDRLMAVNLRSIFLLCQELLPDMIARRQGSIVNIASISAFHTTTEHVAYAASKAAVVAMTRDIASEVSRYGVRVNAVAPGPTDQGGTRSTPHINVLVPYAGGAADIGEAVAFLVSDAARYIVGQTLSVAGGADLRIVRALKPWS
jgi:NAD(P)-dependent dehydrogenase (short-subunit alcohol dehydrogenase family)